MALDFLISDDGRIVTSTYERDGRSRFCLSERTKYGTLISEFSSNSEVLNQVHIASTDNEKGLLEYLGSKERRVVLVGAYRGIKVNSSRVGVCQTVAKTRKDAAMDTNSSVVCSGR